MTEDRLAHSCKVARVIYVLAKMAGMSTEDCCKAFALGLNHDIGYACPKTNSLNHQEVGAKILSKGWGYTDLAYLVGMHGRPDTRYDHIPNGVLLFLLDIADNSVTGKGELASYPERIEDIRKRCPPEAIEYTERVHENMRTYIKLYVQDMAIGNIWAAFDNGTLKSILERELSENK